VHRSQGALLDRASNWRPGDASQQRDHFGLAIAAGFRQHPANMGPDRVQRNAAIRGDVLDSFARRKTACDPRFGRRQIEQRLHQLDGRCLRSRYRHDGQHGGATQKNVARRETNRDDMRDHGRLSVGVAEREGPDPRSAFRIDVGDRVT
jgi:hypothetical protein